MNFSNILSEIEKLDPEIYERTSQRRSVIKNWMRKVTLTTLPLALGALFNKAYGKTNDAITDILEFALTLEQLEMEFYRLGIQATVVDPPKVQLIPTKTGLELPAFQMIYKHEQAHVNFLKGKIEKMTGKPAPPMPKFDFTGGKGSGTGPFSTVFSDYNVFLAVAQTFEDTGVRAYKGQAVGLKSDNDLLTAALRIHSIEARHAAHIRLMRSQTPSPLVDQQNIKPWITLAQSGIAGVPEVQPSYDGEQNTSQGGVEIVKIAGLDHIIDVQASEAFDEPLNKDQILAIVDPFIAP